VSTVYIDQNYTRLSNKCIQTSEIDKFTSSFFTGKSDANILVNVI